MEDDLTQSSAGKTSSPSEGQFSDAEQVSQQVTERLERMEAALDLMLNHLQSQTEGSQMLEAEHSHSMLSSIAIGISAVALIALFTLAAIHYEHAAGIIRFTIGMSLMFLAAVVDLASASLLRRAVSRAVLVKDPSRLIFVGRGPWYRPLMPRYWSTIKREAPDFFHHQLVRYSSFLIYVIALSFLIWAMIRF